MVNGVPGELTPNLVQLYDNFDEIPSYNSSTQHISQSISIDYENKLYNHHYTVIDNPAVVPDEIPLWAFRSSLALNGLLTNIQTLIDGLPEPDKTVAIIQWEYGNYIVRNHPLIISLSSQLGLTETQVNNIFITGSMLK
jgi:hypothetical protein